MTMEELERARQAYREYRTAQQESTIMRWFDRHGDFLSDLVRPAVRENPELREVSMFDIVKTMAEKGVTHE